MGEHVVQRHDPAHARHGGDERRVGDVATDGVERNLGGVDAGHRDAGGHVEGRTDLVGALARVDDDGALGVHALEHVDLPQKGGVHDDHDVGVHHVVVNLDGLIGKARVRLEGRTRALRAELGHGLHVAAVAHGNLSNELGCSDGTLAGARMPANLGQLGHVSPLLSLARSWL